MYEPLAGALERCHRAHTGSNGLFPRIESKEVRSGAPMVRDAPLCPDEVQAFHHVESMTQTWMEFPQACTERTGHRKMYEVASDVNG